MKIMHREVSVKTNEERNKLMFDSYKSMISSLTTIAILNHDQEYIIPQLINALATTIVSGNNPEKMLKFVIKNLKECIDVYVKNESTFKA